MFTNDCFLNEWMNWNELNLNANILIPYISNKHTHTCDNWRRSWILYEHNINICMMPNMLHAIYMLKSMIIIEKGALLFHKWTKHGGMLRLVAVAETVGRLIEGLMIMMRTHMTPCISLAGVSWHEECRSGAGGCCCTRKVFCIVCWWWCWCCCYVYTLSYSPTCPCLYIYLCLYAVRIRKYIQHEFIFIKSNSLMFYELQISNRNYYYYYCLLLCL